jgi:CheY-like chemotaxis protein
MARRKMVAVGVDCAVAASHTEMKAFMEFAASAKVRIDLVIVDVQLDIACLDLPQAYGLMAMTVDDFQLGSSLINQIARHFRLHDHALPSAQADESPQILTESAPSSDNAVLDVLVVEDNNINQIVFAQILESLGLSYKIATTGKQALQLFEQEKPSFVLMDTTLPDFDGFEATRRLRKTMGAQPNPTPIIGVIALAFEGDRQACMDAGMDDMLLKPVSPDMVAMLFKRHLPHSQHRICG